MATVWLAQLRGKRGFEKLFAIKTIRTELVEDSRFQEMFLDEARIASGIQHPNVAQILDLGEERDVLFIVMEWVDGDSVAKIRKLLSKRKVKFPLGITLRVLADACAGLHAAHELRDDRGEPLGIVHRDVSPQNLLLGTAGGVKVIDFGIAKAQNRKQGATRTGVVKGKVQYMAPEQVKKGRTVDRRADIWSLGICLHELVAGKTPNDADDDVETIRKLLADEAPERAPDMPEAIVRILEASMVLDPDARFPTAAGMQRALEGAMKELDETTTTEDVASFLRRELPELADGRRGVVTKAVEEARERGTPAPGAVNREDVAFAPTQISDRNVRPAEEASTIALTKRKDGSSRSPVPATDPAKDDSRVRASSPPDGDAIVIPKRSRLGLWLTLLILAGGIGTLVRWPAAAGRIFGLGGGSNVEARPVASGEAPAEPSGSAGPWQRAASQPTAAVPSPSETAAPPEATAGATATPGAGTSYPALHHTWPELATHPSAHGAAAPLPSLPLSAQPPIVSTPAASAPPPVAPPSAAASAPAPAPAPPAPSAAPSQTPDDPGNPY
jgi:serine/threonine-protein kinase